MQRKTVALAIALASALAIFDMPAQAQSWPSRPIRIILPNPPGGTNDILARMLQAPLQEILGQPIVVENRAGGSNIIATDAIVRSPPDGYTIGTIISVHASNVALQPKLPYDSIKDITPIAFLGYVGNIVVVHPSVKANSMQELTAQAKAIPGTIHHGSSGIGTSQHFSGELLKLRTGAEFVHVPYRGGGPAINDLLGGHIQMMFGNFTSILPHVRAGTVRPLAVTAGIVDKLNAAFYDALKRPDIAPKLRDQGIEVKFMTPTQLREFINAEIAKLGDIAKRANMRLPD